MIRVSPRTLQQATQEYLQGPPPGYDTAHWIDDLIFQIDETNPPLAEHLRHLFHLVQERHGQEVPLDIVMIAVWTVFRADVLTAQETARNN